MLILVSSGASLITYAFAQKVVRRLGLLNKRAVRNSDPSLQTCRWTGGKLNPDGKNEREAFGFNPNQTVFNTF